jgi:crotonobetainyl-CoA:carnitine CoA-transferase CaiB-like acyl-CoA transferase
MLRAALDLQSEVLMYHLNGAQLRKSPTSLASMIHPGPYGIYETKDGYLALSMSPLPVLQDALQLPELAPLATERFNHPAREQVSRLLEPVIRTRTTGEWVEYLVPKGIWAAPVLDYDGVFADPAVQDANVIEEIDHPTAGRVRLLRFPLKFSSGQAATRRVPPTSGEHSAEILRELGYGDADVARLQQQKVV